MWLGSLRGDHDRQERIHASNIIPINIADVQMNCPGKNSANNITLRNKTKDSYHSSDSRQAKNTPIGQLNGQSCVEKSFNFRDLIKEPNIDVIVITQTWLQVKGHEAKLKELATWLQISISFPRYGKN